MLGCTKGDSQPMTELMKSIRGSTGLALAIMVISFMLILLIAGWLAYDLVMLSRLHR